MSKETVLCGARSDKHLVTCQLGQGHAKTLEDWHEAATESGSHVKTNIYEVTVTAIENIRWQPNPFELDDPEERSHALEQLGRPSRRRSKE